MQKHIPNVKHRNANCSNITTFYKNTQTIRIWSTTIKVKLNNANLILFVENQQEPIDFKPDSTVQLICQHSSKNHWTIQLQFSKTHFVS